MILNLTRLKYSMNYIDKSSYFTQRDIKPNVSLIILTIAYFLIVMSLSTSYHRYQSVPRNPIMVRLNHRTLQQIQEIWGTAPPSWN